MKIQYRIKRVHQRLRDELEDLRRVLTAEAIREMRAGKVMNSQPAWERAGKIGSLEEVETWLLQQHVYYL